MLVEVPGSQADPALRSTGPARPARGPDPLGQPLGSALPARNLPLSPAQHPGNASNGRRDDDLDLADLDAALADPPRRRRRRTATAEPPEPPDALVRPRKPRRTTTPERRAVVAVAVLSGLVAAFSPVQPTAFGPTDVLLRFAFAYVVTAAAARARRSTWIILSGAAAVLAPSGIWFVAALVALVAAVVAAFVPRRRLTGACIALLALPALMRAEAFGFTGASALCVWAAVIPVLVSGYRVASRRSRERMHTVATAAVLVALVGTIVFAVGVWISYHDLSNGSTTARSGLSALRDGRGSDAAVLLANSSDSLGDAHDVLGGWWMTPAHLVPFVSQQLDALSTASAQGHDVASAGSVVAAKADYHQLRYVQGQIDVNHLRQLDGPLRTVNRVLIRAEAQLRSVRSPWLVGPVRGAVDTFHDEVVRTTPQAQVAEQAVAVAPGMLGGDGTRHYFVAFTTEAESRGLNGFMGNWAELTATDGRLTLSRSGRTGELDNQPGAADRVVKAPPDYVSRYARFKVGTYFQDVTLSPDLPDVAQVISQLYSGPTPDMGGDKIDGVLVVDPYALAALLQFTGPINITGGPQLNATNAAQQLVEDQYTEFAGKSDRVDFLDQASRETFEALTRGSIPGPDQIATVLGPQVAQRHLMFTSFRGSEQALFTRLGATGAYSHAQAGRDFFGLTGQNSANNKTDVWMHRSVTYDAHYDPGTGRVDATATITLHNLAPSNGLPEGVIGSNGQGLPLGTNRTYLSFYTPLQLQSAAVGSQSQGFESQLEFGYNVYSQYLTVPSGGTLVVTLHLRGVVAAGLDYRLGMGIQPMVNPDQIQVVITPTGPWQVAQTSGIYAQLDKSRATLVTQPGHDLSAEVHFERT
jgi:hypothetical protein